MGDGLKISKDRRHRSSSSIVGDCLEGTRSERKLDLKNASASIPEVDDHFAIAEARCDDLQEKLDLVKDLKRKRKLKKRSTTRVTEPPCPETMPFISVRTQPKKKLKHKAAGLLITEVSQGAARLRRLEPPNPVRGYLDPATAEQHHMISQVRGNRAIQQPQQLLDEGKHFLLNQAILSKVRPRRARAAGDSLPGSKNAEVACGDDDTPGVYSELEEQGGRRWEDISSPMNKTPPQPTLGRQQSKLPKTNYRRHVPRDVIAKEETAVRTNSMTSNRRRQTSANNQPLNKASTQTLQDDRPVVELFNKKRLVQNNVLTKHIGHETCGKEIPETKEDDEEETLNNSAVKSRPRRVKYRVHRYELPTVASQMKQAGMRYYSGSSNHSNIPFIISKSCAPSHNIGVNIQQVLNGLKIQQPLSGIPLTIAHHMGLGHIPLYAKKNMQPSLEIREINAIQLGQRLLRLPSYKYMSYNKLLNMYRESDGLVSRFLRAISRPHYFYTSMYNLATRDDFDGATSTSKGRNANQEAKQSLAEYASLYREFEQIDKRLKESYDVDLDQRKEELVHELAAREEHIRRVVQEYKPAEAGQPTLRASASTADDCYRYSTLKLNLVDTAQ